MPLNMMIAWNNEQAIAYRNARTGQQHQGFNEDDFRKIFSADEESDDKFVGTFPSAEDKANAFVVLYKSSDRSKSLSEVFVSELGSPFDGSHQKIEDTQFAVVIRNQVELLRSMGFEQELLSHKKLEMRQLTTGSAALEAASEAAAAHRGLGSTDFHDEMRHVLDHREAVLRALLNACQVGYDSYRTAITGVNDNSKSALREHLLTLFSGFNSYALDMAKLAGESGDAVLLAMLLQHQEKLAKMQGAQDAISKPKGEQSSDLSFVEKKVLTEDDIAGKFALINARQILETAYGAAQQEGLQRPADAGMMGNADEMNENGARPATGAVVASDLPALELKRYKAVVETEMATSWVAKCECIRKYLSDFINGVRNALSDCWSGFGYSAQTKLEAASLLELYSGGRRVGPRESAWRDQKDQEFIDRKLKEYRKMICTTSGGSAHGALENAEKEAKAQAWAQQDLERAKAAMDQGLLGKIKNASRLKVGIA